MRIIGIDPGLSGAAFLYDTNTFEFQSHRLESHDGRLDVQTFASFILRQLPDIIFVEKIFLTGKEGGQSAMTIGSNYGRLMAVVEGSKLPYVEVAPKTWQRALGFKGGSRAIVKQEAQDYAVKRFTLMPFIYGKSKKPHDGCTDAACIALYGMFHLSENLWEDDTKTKLTKSTHKSARSTVTSAKSSSRSKAKKKTQSRRSKSRSTTSKVKSRKSA